MVWQLRGQTKYRYLEVMEYTPQASFYFIIGYLFFCFFFFAKSPRYDNWLYSREDIENDYSDIRVHHAWILYGVFFVLYVIYLSLRGRSVLSQLTLGQQGNYSDDILSSTDSNLWFLMVSLNALVSISVVLLVYQKNYRWTTYIVYIVTLLFTVSAGYRHLMIDAILAPILVRSILNKKKISIPRLLLIVVCLYLVVSWVGAMRGVYRTGVGTLSGFESSSAFDSFMINIEVFSLFCLYKLY